ncbi:MAG: sigma 54-interacting transcriptional regulator, partial [Polyangia bacterium]
KPIKVDVRIIAATNRNLEEEVRGGRFRQDLFYRLSVVRVFLPPLRDRIEDIPLLVKHFLADASYNKRPDGTAKVTGMSRAAMDLLTTYKWPGNVRELVNTIERAISFAEGELVDARDLPETVRGEEAAPRAQAAGGAQPMQPMPDSDSTFKDAKERWVSSFERDYIVTLLKKNKGNISHAAREADIDRKYFRKLMRKYGIEGGGDEDEGDTIT